MLRTTIVALAAVAAASVSIAAPGQTGPPPSQMEGRARDEATARLEQLKADLALTPEQEAKTRPLVEEHMKRLTEIRAAHPGSPRDMTDAERLELRNALTSAQHDLDAKLEGILTPEQIEKLHAHRENMRQHVRERRIEAPRPPHQER